jgi:hypothetical protein
MQSLGQAVYRFICKYSTEGVGKRAIAQEMTVRGYLSPVSERVEGALQDYIHMGKVVFRRGRYIHSKALEVVL